MTVRVHDLTGEQRSALQPAGDLIITGPPASGRTTALLHAAMHAMGTDLIEARQVVLLIADQQAWPQGRRILKAHRSLLGVQVMTAARLASLIDPEWAPPEEKERTSYRAWRDREAATRRTADTERALQEVTSGTQEAAWRAECVKAGRENLTGGLARFTNVERVLRSAARFEDPGQGQAMREALPALFPLILVDDLELFSPADLLFITALRLFFQGERRSRLLITSEPGHRLNAWASRLSAGPAHHVALTDHMNRSQVLSLIEALDTRVQGNDATPVPQKTRVPARGMSQEFNPIFRLCISPHEGGVKRVAFHDAPFTEGVLEALRGHVTDALHKAHTSGQDTAVVLATSIRKSVEHELRHLWKVKEIPETNDAPPELLAALRCVNGLSRPSGGHPLYDGSLAEQWEEAKEREAADKAWARGTPLPATAIHARLEGLLNSSSTTADVIRHLRITLPGDPLPDDPLRALERLLARQDEPRRYILPAVRFTHSWPQTIYICSEYIDRSELRNVLTHTLDRAVIMIVPEYGARVADLRATNITYKRLAQLATQYSWPLGKLNGSEPLTAQELKDLLNHPAIGRYLRLHAPRTTDEATMVRWMTLLEPDSEKRTQWIAQATATSELTMTGTDAQAKALSASPIPAEWLTIKEPARPWHAEVKLLGEQRLIR